MKEKSILDFIRELMEDLSLTEEEKKNMTLEVPERTMEKFARVLKQEALESGLILVADSRITGEGQDLRIAYAFTAVEKSVLTQGTLNIKHSNKFALYPNVNEKEYR